jgi:O-antigen/teichoic acid export membrane protein
MNVYKFRSLQEVPMSGSSVGRAGRLLAGWSANSVQLLLGLVQQVALVPVFLHFWTSEVLAAWLVIYAVGNLVLIADGGLQFRAINRFLSFKSGMDADARTARFYAALLRVYLCLSVVLAVLVLAVCLLVSPTVLLRFQAIADFDVAFVVMTAGIVLTLPSGLVVGLYRARGLYGRAVWLQNWGTLVGQAAQLVAVVVTGSLLAVVIAYVATQMLLALYLLVVDARRRFPFLSGAGKAHSLRWVIGQFRKGAPFGIAAATELALLNLPVLLVSALVSDRVAVAQWGLTRVVAGLLRALCLQVTLPLAAELGHDHAIGATDRLRNLYARGSVLVTLLASLVVSGLLPFWQDFFALWTHGAVPYDPMLTVTLLIGTALAAPSILTLSYAYYSNRGELLLRTKGLQLVVFLVLSVILIPLSGLVGAAIALVATDLLIQFGVLGRIIMQQTLQHPLRHVGFLAAVMMAVTLAGWALGTAIRLALPFTGGIRFFAECALWLAVVLATASPLAFENVRARLTAAIPR